MDELTERPSPTVGVIALGVMGIALGALLLISVGLNIVGQIMQGAASQGQPNPMLEMQKDPMVKLFSYTGLGVMLIASVPFIISGIGLFRLRPWAWKLATATGVTFLLWLVLSTVASHVILSERMAPYMDELFESEDMRRSPPILQNFTRFSVSPGGRAACTLVCCLPIPLIFLVGLVLPGVRKQFFDEETAAPPIERGSDRHD